MSFFGRLLGDVVHGVEAGVDVVSGNVVGAAQNVAALKNPFSKPKPKIVSASTPVYGGPGGGSTGTYQLASANLGPTAIMPATATITSPGTTTVAMNNTDMISFFQWLANHDWQGTWDMFLQMMQHPFSDWGTNIQNLYQSWLSAKGGSTSLLPSGSGSVQTVGIHQVVSYRANKPGYVVVDDNGTKIAVRKEVARAEYGWKPRKKPPISVKDWERAKAAKRVEKKIQSVASKLDMKAEKSHKWATRGRSSRSRTRPQIEEAVIIAEKGK